jgi:malate dehydrogenase (oxaloacetate-decarboxylating)
MDINKLALNTHKKYRGKIGTVSKFGPLKTRTHLSIAYTPGVGAVSKLLTDFPDRVNQYTSRGNSIAVISDGSAVLGLGNIGPLGALPVMEGKALLFKELAGIDAYPIVLATQNSEEIIQTICAIAPTFSGINLEDISAPRCFDIEEQLIELLPIPIMHDDQHCSAIVVLAGLINSLKLTGKDTKVNIVICGSGAAGTGIIGLLKSFGFINIIAVDSKGIISKKRTDLNPEKRKLLNISNVNNKSGTLSDAMQHADVFIGVSGPNIVSAKMIETMNIKPIVFAMANPIPEIDPKTAKKAGAFIVGTGRSDLPNQINNVLAFPGVFRGALDNNIRKITNEMKIRASFAIASCVPKSKLTKDFILPSALDRNVVKKVAASIR